MSDVRDRIPANIPPTSSVSSDRPFYPTTEYGQPATSYGNDPFRHLHPLAEPNQLSYPGYPRYPPHPSSQSLQPYSGHLTTFHSPQLTYAPVMATPVREQQPQPDGPAFSGTEMHCSHLFDENNTNYRLDIIARIQKNFFRLGSRWTCYRRNYFNVHVQIQVTPSTNGLPLPPLYVQIQGQRHAVRAFAVTLSAKTQDANDRPGEPRELIQHTAKRNKETQGKPALVQLTPYTQPPSMAVPMTPSMGTYSPYGTQSALQLGSYNFFGHPASHPPPIHHVYERLQFQKATLNNGKRRAQQQFYHLVVELYGDVNDGHGPRWIKLATKQSEALVVRGRSPGHYKHDKGTDGGTRHGAGPGSSRPHHHPGQQVPPDPYTFHATGWQRSKRNDYPGAAPRDGRDACDGDLSDHDGVLSPNPPHYSSEVTPSSSDCSENDMAMMRQSNGLASPGRSESGHLPQARSNILQQAMSEAAPTDYRSAQAAMTGLTGPYTRDLAMLTI